MAKRRVPRLNSLLKEVISEVVHKDLHHFVQNVEMLSVTSVDITDDLSSAKVFISVIGDEKVKKEVCSVLNARTRLIAHKSSRKVVMRIFPRLEFFIDEGLEKQLRICEILSEVLPNDQIDESCE